MQTIAHGLTPLHNRQKPARLIAVLNHTVYRGESVEFCPLPTYRSL